MSRPLPSEMDFGDPPPVPAFKAADLEVQVVLSLAKATRNALMNLSPLAYREIDLALRREAARLYERRDDRSTLTATLLTQYVPA